MELKPHEVIWLREVERRMIEDRSTVPAEVMVALRAELPRGFVWTEVTQALRTAAGLSVEGVDAIGDSGKYLPDVERAILLIAKRLIEDPALTHVTVEQLAEELNLPATRAEQVLGLIVSCRKFSIGENPTPRGAQSIQLNSPEILAEYLGFHSIREFLDRIAFERGKPSAPATSTSTKPPQEKGVNANTAFIVMAMDPTEPSLTDVCDAIKAACEAFEIKAYRADDIEHQDQITDKVLEHIATAEFIIADLTYERPNVYYEIGYAHALRKRPILIRKSGTKLHFDLAVHNAREYKNLAELRIILLRRFEAILGHPPKTV